MSIKLVCSSSWDVNNVDIFY